MSFTGFKKEDFNVFNIDGLEQRMEGIRSNIQPKFRSISDDLLDDLSLMVGNEMFLHIAKHARRKVNAPVDTWMSFCENKRGYKQHPHFQIGLFDDRVFVWLALIYELPNKKRIAENYLNNLDEIMSIIPNDFDISLDHMKKDALSFSNISKIELREILERFRDINKVELLIGKTFKHTDHIVSNGDFLTSVRNIYSTLIPLYKLAQL